MAVYFQLATLAERYDSLLQALPSASHVSGDPAEPNRTEPRLSGVQTAHVPHQKECARFGRQCIRARLGPVM